MLTRSNRVFIYHVFSFKNDNSRVEKIKLKLTKNRQYIWKCSILISSKLADNWLDEEVISFYVPILEYVLPEIVQFSKRLRSCFSCSKITYK
jgi:hypothetical protein